MTDEVISPLRRRMIEDMTIRKLVPKTQQGYIRNVKAFAAFLGRSPSTASREDVRRFQLHLTSSGAGTPKINSTVTALRFFFDVTLDRPDIAKPPPESAQPPRGSLRPLPCSTRSIMRLESTSDTLSETTSETRIDCRRTAVLQPGERFSPLAHSDALRQRSEPKHEPPA